MSSLQNSLSSDAPLTTASFSPLHDVICRVEVLLGTASMSVRECVRLRRDSIIRLNEAAGGDLRVVVNGIAVAQGEIVIVEDSTAVRITEVLAPPNSEASE